MIPCSTITYRVGGGLAILRIGPRAEVMLACVGGKWVLGAREAKLVAGRRVVAGGDASHEELREAMIGQILKNPKRAKWISTLLGKWVEAKQQEISKLEKEQAERVAAYNAFVATCKVLRKRDSAKRLQPSASAPRRRRPLPPEQENVVDTPRSYLVIGSRTALPASKDEAKELLT